MATNAHVKCPHCESTGTVKTKQVKMKQGISGGKATGAVMTAGLSLFATGLSRKQQVTEMACTKCGTVWHVA
jgi:DNA-directed RNA polymerase subunit RPC12/RpoP